MKITADQLYEKLNYTDLVARLKSAFASDDYQIPQRLHFDLPQENTSLIMPAWNHKYFGLKQIIACPGNKETDLHTIQGKFDLFDIKNGIHLAEIDAGALTAIRTAATSLLASSFFCSNPRQHLVMGSGVIGHHLIQTYRSFYGIETSMIWSRSLDGEFDLKEAVYHSDIVSCATLAEDPILKGVWLNQKTHLDLVGSFKPSMREVDDDAVVKCAVYIDDWSALKETGDLAIPIQKDILKKEEIMGTLFDLCKGSATPTNHGLTLFKSVGHALEDLVAAIYFYELYF
ncbi:hypothetical protein [Portibacter marinus]|uniref:hypothetical protein n=1 Tax=Portibacter marinus TaxID=2898660 RepID=UPI001F3EE28D|nr:hypothetical protein [Portibacter marinus]